MNTDARPVERRRSGARDWCDVPRRGIRSALRPDLASVAIVEQNAIAPPGAPCLPADAAPFWFALLSLTMFGVAIGYVVVNFVGRGESWPQRRFLSFVTAS